MRKISFPCPCSFWWCSWLCAAFPGSGCGRMDGRSKPDLARCRMASDVLWLHFCSHFIRLTSTYHRMQCTRTNLKSPFWKNMVFFSSLITVIQWISVQFTYSDKKSLTNGQFSISWNTTSGCISPGCGPPWVPVHSLPWREAAWPCFSLAWPGIGRGPPGAAEEGLVQPCHRECCHLLSFPLLQLTVLQWLGSWSVSPPSVGLFHQSPRDGV